MEDPRLTGFARTARDWTRAEWPAIRTAFVLVLLSFCSYLVLYWLWSQAHPQRGFVEAFLQWDSRWYLTIVDHGYMYRPEPRGGVNWVFFPLYPVLVWAFKTATGLSAEVSGLVVSNVALFGAVVLSQIYLRETRSKDAAIVGAVLLCFAPYSFYFSTMYTESLFVFLLAAGFYALHRRYWVWGGLIGGCLSATRVVGGFFGLALLAAYLEYHLQRGVVPRAIPKAIATDPKQVIGAGLVPSGALCYMAFLYLHVGNPLAFVTGERAWGRTPKNPLDVLEAAVLGHGHPHSIVPVYLALWALFGLLAGVYLLYRRQYAEGAFLLPAIVFPLSTGLTSMPRYVVGTLAFYFVVAEVVARNRLASRWAWLAVLAAVNGGLLFLWFDRLAVMV